MNLGVFIRERGVFYGCRGNFGHDLVELKARESGGLAADRDGQLSGVVDDRVKESVRGIEGEGIGQFGGELATGVPIGIEHGLFPAVEVELIIARSEVIKSDRPFGESEFGEQGECF